MATYYYFDKNDKIRSTGILLTARAGTIQFLFHHPDFTWGYIAKNKAILEYIRCGFDKVFSNYDSMVDEGKQSRDILEVISDDGRNFFTIKCTNGKWGKRYDLFQNGKIKEEWHNPI